MVKQQRCHAHYLAELGLNLLMDGLVALLHLLLVFDHHGEPVQRARVELLSVGLHDLTQVLSLLHHVSPRLKSSKGDREGRDERERVKERDGEVERETEWGNSDIIIFLNIILIKSQMFSL